MSAYKHFQNSLTKSPRYGPKPIQMTVRINLHLGSGLRQLCNKYVLPEEPSGKPSRRLRFLHKRFCERMASSRHLQTRFRNPFGRRGCCFLVHSIWSSRNLVSESLLTMRPAVQINPSLKQSKTKLWTTNVCSLENLATGAGITLCIGSPLRENLQLLRPSACHLQDTQETLLKHPKRHSTQC